MSALDQWIDAQVELAGNEVALTRKATDLSVFSWGRDVLAQMVESGSFTSEPMRSTLWALWLIRLTSEGSGARLSPSYASLTVPSECPMLDCRIGIRKFAGGPVSLFNLTLTLGSTLLWLCQNTEQPEKYAAFAEGVRTRLKP